MDKSHIADVVVRESDRAKGFLNNQQRALGTLKAASQKLHQLRGPASRVIGDLRVMIRLVRSWMSGAYQGAPKKSIIAALAGILYFVNPFDIVPDFAPVIGYLDDASVVSFVWRSIQDDVQRFLSWERQGNRLAA